MSRNMARAALATGLVLRAVGMKRFSFFEIGIPAFLLGYLFVLEHGRSGVSALLNDTDEQVHGLHGIFASGFSFDQCAAQDAVCNRRHFFSHTIVLFSCSGQMMERCQ